jgi:dephospho-CoA kinase
MPKVRGSVKPLIPTKEKKKTTFIVGLTGAMGAGKSTVSAYLRDRAIPVVDADHLARQALAKGGDGYRAVVRLFGPSCVGADGELDRAGVAKAVFSNTRLLKQLESILHPIVLKEIKRRIAAHRRGLLVLDVPLLFETGVDRWVDQTVTVWAPRSLCLARLADAKQWSKADVARRLKAQMPPWEKVRRSDRVLDNRGTRRALYRQIDRWLSTLPLFPGKRLPGEGG